jgi:hypothetical protein
MRLGGPSPVGPAPVHGSRLAPNPVSEPDQVASVTPEPHGSNASPQTEIALLRRRLESQQLLSDIFTQFIDLPVERIDGHINQALGRVACFLGFNLAAISKFYGQGIAGEVTHIWTAQELLLAHDEDTGIVRLCLGRWNCDGAWRRSRIRRPSSS